MYYRLSQDFSAPSMGKIIALLCKDMAQTSRIVEDRQKLKRICGEDMNKLCRRLFCKP